MITKKRLSLLLSVVFLFSLFSLPSCMIESSENLEYSTTSVACTITGVGKNRSRKIVIPSEIEGKPVTAIANNAFKNNDWLYSVSIPSSVTYVGEYAFYDCDFLRYATIDMPSGSRIMPYAFAKCNRLKEAYLTNFYCLISDFPPAALFYDAKQSAEYLKKTYADRLILPSSRKLISEPHPEYFNSYEEFFAFYQEEFNGAGKKIAIFRGFDSTRCFTVYNGAYDLLEEKPLFAPYVDRLCVTSFFYTNADNPDESTPEDIRLSATSYFFDETLQVEADSLTFNFIEDPNGYSNRCSYEVYLGNVILMECMVQADRNAPSPQEKFEEAIGLIKENMIIL